MQTPKNTIKSERQPLQKNMSVAEVGILFRNELEKLYQQCCEHYNPILGFLPDVKLPNGFELRLDAFNENDSQNMFRLFYVYDPENNKRYQPGECVRISLSPMGLWQNYLFEHMGHMCTLWKHTPGMDRRFIFERSDWERMPELRVQDVDPMEKKQLLYPRVSMGEIRDGSGSFLGEVSCTYCMDENLYRDCRRYIIHKDGTVAWNWGEPFSSIIVLYEKQGHEIY